MIKGLKDTAVNGRFGNKVNSEEELTSVSFRFHEKQDAVNFAALFPKYVKVKVSSISDFLSGETWPMVNTQIYLNTNKVTGERNETAEKRRNKFFEVLRENNIDIFNCM